MQFLNLYVRPELGNKQKTVVFLCQNLTCEITKGQIYKKYYLIFPREKCTQIKNSVNIRTLLLLIFPSVNFTEI